MKSIQPDWCFSLPLQQQSVLLLAARGADGVSKQHPSKVIQRAYRACVLRGAAIVGRKNGMMRWGERGDSFMCLQTFSNAPLWVEAVKTFFQFHDELPRHYYQHLMHGVEILGYKHPDKRFRNRWHSFYLLLADEAHLNPETLGQMDARLNDFGKC